jgi:Mlc titration factor MtfA (ptsG expression regulator)
MRWPFVRASRPRDDIDRSDWIDDAHWSALFGTHEFLARLSQTQRARLRSLCGAFLATKAINGAQGLVVDEDIVASIAVQACLPILELGLASYPKFEEIVVHPGDFVIEREIVDADGVVHAWSEHAAGESWGDDGPMVLSWDAADPVVQRARQRGRPVPFVFNVVIHEFVHKLDAGNDAIDGMPAFTRALHAGIDPRAWHDTLIESLDDFAARVDAVERSIPRHVDPESMRADRYYAKLPLDAYAATDEAEFFSVSSEAFFVGPARLAEAYPDWYRLLVAYYRQDPSKADT